jgi:ribonuclease P protein component
MLPKKYRLPLRHFPQFFSQSHTTTSPHFVMYSLNETSAEVNNVQFAVITPIKKIGNAVKRHYTKRIVHVALAQILAAQSEGNHNSKRKIVVYVKKSIANSTFAQLHQELTKLLYV